MKPYYQELAEKEYREAYAAGKELLRYSGEPAPWLVEFAESSSFPQGARVIDFACGEGINAIYLARRGCDVTGIDISSEAIGRAGELARKAGVDIEYRVGDIVCCPEIPDGSFDVALACACFGRLLEDEHRLGFLKESARVLNPGGTLFFNNGIALKEIEQSFPDVYEKLRQGPDFSEWLREEQSGRYVPPSQRYETRAGYESLLASVGYRMVHCQLDVSDRAWGIVIWARKARGQLRVEVAEL